MEHTTPHTLAHWWFSTWGAQPPHPIDRSPPLTHQPINFHPPTPYPTLIISILPAYHPLSAWWSITIFAFLVISLPSGLPFCPVFSAPRPLLKSLYPLSNYPPYLHISPTAPFTHPHPALSPSLSFPMVADPTPHLLSYQSVPGILPQLPSACHYKPLLAPAIPPPSTHHSSQPIGPTSCSPRSPSASLPSCPSPAGTKIR